MSCARAPGPIRVRPASPATPAAEPGRSSGARRAGPGGGAGLAGPAAGAGGAAGPGVDRQPGDLRDDDARGRAQDASPGALVTLGKQGLTAIDDTGKNELPVSVPESVELEAA